MSANRHQLTIGIVGLGTHGTNHTQALRELGHDLVGTDADPTIRTEFEDQFGAETVEHPSTLFEEAIDAYTFDGERVFSRKESISIDTQASRAVTVVPDDAFGDVPPESVFVRTEFHPVDDVESYPDFAFFESVKHLELPEPEITVDVEGTDVVLETTDAALFLAVDDSLLSGHFSDNYVHPTPGSPFDSPSRERPARANSRRRCRFEALNRRTEREHGSRGLSAGRVRPFPVTIDDASHGETAIPFGRGQQRITERTDLNRVRLNRTVATRPPIWGNENLGRHPREAIAVAAETSDMTDRSRSVRRWIEIPT
ncbi:glycoside hydrolase family 2 protein [Natrialba sp. INN-245]|uniref:glycoside hydrolase family 2 protein n=1 Tax=Natrialba sp. INN-245 TaxID=2690967 RepID=UPI0013130510|nr:glycoside hydrolase family 2 protein [Natrialba sp. INN-245]MWV39886.1 hypothetical protein [Natrialba sp. INN-245]